MMKDIKNSLEIKLILEVVMVSLITKIYTMEREVLRIHGYQKLKDSKIMIGLLDLKNTQKLDMFPQKKN